MRGNKRETRERCHGMGGGQDGEGNLGRDHVREVGTLASTLNFGPSLP